MYLALALGVDAYDWDLHELIGVLLRGSPVGALRLRDIKGNSKITTLSSSNNQVFVSLVPGLHTLSWRRALAWELIMLLGDEGIPKCIPVLDFPAFPPPWPQIDLISLLATTSSFGRPRHNR